MAARMGTKLMSTTVALDASPASVLRSMRGRIVAAQIAYPDVLHVQVRDSTGAVWRLATQDAGFSPLDPAKLLGRTVDGAEIDETTGGLHCSLSDGSSLDVYPTKDPQMPENEEREEPPSWELIAPDGLVLEFGPGLRWQIASGSLDGLSRRRKRRTIRNTSPDNLE